VAFFQWNLGIGCTPGSTKTLTKRGDSALQQELASSYLSHNDQVFDAPGIVNTGSVLR